MSWTDERVSLLTKLWGEGHTAAEIAKQLGGVTRNAVIGKAHRLKLSNRLSPIQQNKKPANKNVEKKPLKKVVSVIQPKEPVNDVQIKPEQYKKPENLYSLLDLKPRMCRWPCGDPKHDDFGFCGDNAMPGLPYCEDHARIAYQAATRNRIFNNSDAGRKDKKILENAADALLKKAKSS